MKYLIDTHAFLWWITDSQSLSKKVREIIGKAGNDLFWSVASSWEVAIKYKLGRLPLPDTPSVFITSELFKNRIESVQITNEHAFTAGQLPPHHKDPFDRMLISQAQLEDMTILSSHSTFQVYEVKTVW